MRKAVSAHSNASCNDRASYNNSVLTIETGEFDLAEGLFYFLNYLSSVLVKIQRKLKRHWICIGVLQVGSHTVPGGGR